MTEEVIDLLCADCGDAIDCCEFCDKERCADALCGRCVRHDVRDAVGTTARPS